MTDDFETRYAEAYGRCQRASKALDSAWIARAHRGDDLTAAINEFNAAGIALAALRDERLRGT